MAQYRVILVIVCILLLSSISHAAQYEAEIDVLVINGQPVADIPPCSLDSDDEEGMQYINGGGERLGGFEGWCDGELVRLYTEIKAGYTIGLKARVFLHTSPEKMVKWHNVGWKGKKLLVKDLKSEKARAKKVELMP